MLEKTARRCHFGSQPSLHLAFVFLLHFGGRKMSEGGKQSFAQFAADQNFPGVELDNTRRWNSGFKKVAVSPEHHRRRGTSTPPEVASERYLKAPRRGEIYEGRKATGRSDYAKARSESARNTPTVRPTGERPDLSALGEIKGTWR